VTPSATPEATISRRLVGSTGDELFGDAIARTLRAPASERANLLEELLREITTVVASSDAGLRPWICVVQQGTDGSRVFCGGVGLSIVVDPHGRLWRARTYEDFDTTYTITLTSCEIATMTPQYAAMREYLPR
jgi:hypothetical protein